MKMINEVACVTVAGLCAFLVAHAFAASSLQLCNLAAMPCSQWTPPHAPIGLENTCCTAAEEWRTIACEDTEHAVTLPSFFMACGMLREYVNGNCQEPVATCGGMLATGGCQQQPCNGGGGGSS